MILDHNDLFTSYVKHCRSAVDILLDTLNAQLHLPPGTLEDLHRITEPSGDHVRFTHNAPNEPFDEARARKGEHTDFGSMTILFNWLGGLQIRTPDTDTWVYVKPIPGSCVVNLGDALVKFTAGLLRSNVHRVVPPPANQTHIPRTSLVFFTRPEDRVVLKRLKGGLIDAQPQRPEDNEEITSAEWIFQRGTGQKPGIYTSKGFEERSFDLNSAPGIKV